MKRLVFLAILFLLLNSTAFSGTPPFDIKNTSAIDPAKEQEVLAKIGILQIPFIKNESQIKDSRVKYYANTFAGTVFITDDGIVYALKGDNVGADPRVRPGH